MWTISGSSVSVGFSPSFQTYLSGNGEHYSSSQANIPGLHRRLQELNQLPAVWGMYRQKAASEHDAAYQFSEIINRSNKPKTVICKYDDAVSFGFFLSDEIFDTIFELMKIPLCNSGMRYSFGLDFIAFPVRPVQTNTTDLNDFMNGQPSLCEGFTFTLSRSE